MQIKCMKNCGYKWYNRDNSYFRGYIQLEDGTVYRNNDAIMYLKQSNSFDEFANSLQKLFGVFSVIISKPDETWAAVDIARSMPLYYTSDGSMISDTVDIIKEEKKINNSRANPHRLLELYECTYIAYNNTVFDDIKQLSAGTCVRLSKDDISIKHYYKHINRTKQIDKRIAIIELKNHTENMIRRIKKAVGDRTIVISLSGGHDSRYLACSLKMSGFNNVICFSYGKKGSDEVKMSETIAKALNYEWHNIEYTDEMITSLLSNETEEFFQFSNNYDSTTYLQNYLAVRELTHQQMIPSNAVFITGLCNDMPTGQYIPAKQDICNYSMDNQGAVNYLFDKRIFRLPITKEAENEIKQYIRQSMHEKKIQITDYQSFIQGTDSEITDYEHTRWFSNMNKAHSFFGYEWLMPCWDKELLDFWYQMPAELRYKQDLYNEYIKQLTNNYSIPNTIVAASYGSNQTLVKIKRTIGGIIVRIAYPLKISLRRKADINNFAPLETEIYRRITNKKMIDMKYAGMMYLLTVYELEQKYGSNWFTMIKTYKK